MGAEHGVPVSVNLVVVAALCVAGCQRSASVAPGGAANDIKWDALADIEAAIQSDGLERARYDRGLDQWERGLLVYMIEAGVREGPGPETRDILAMQVIAGPVLYSDTKDRAQPWKFALCYGDLFRGHAPAVIEAVGPDPDDRVLVTATLTIRPGRVDSFAIRRADGEPFESPWSDSFHPQSDFDKSEWRISTRGSVN